VPKEPGVLRDSGLQERLPVLLSFFVWISRETMLKIANCELRIANLKIRNSFLLQCLFICLFPLTSAADHFPLLTESPQTLPPGQFAVDVGLQFLNHHNFPFSQFSETFSRNVLSLPTLGLAVGLGKRVELQLRYEVLFVEEDELRIRERWKSGDLAFFTKIAIREEGRYLPGTGIKLGAKLPNAMDAYRVGTDETDLAFAALAEKTLSSLTVTSHLGLLILGDPFSKARQDDLLAYGVACSFPWNSSLASTIEVVGQAFGTSHNERASVVAHLFFEDGRLTWNISGRGGLLENSERWGLSGGVRIRFTGFSLSD
jgi:hypothetical protein